jgi:hypothetical protein
VGSYKFSKTKKDPDKNSLKNPIPETGLQFMRLWEREL